MLCHLEKFLHLVFRQGVTVLFGPRTSNDGQLSADLTATRYLIAADDLDNLLYDVGRVSNYIRWEMRVYEWFPRLILLGDSHWVVIFAHLD